MQLNPSKKYCPDDFEFKKVIGTGSFSTVFLSKLKFPDGFTKDLTEKTSNEASIDVHSSRFTYAIKILNKKHIIKHNKIKYVTIEKDILLKMNHQNIVKLFGTFQDSSNLYFVLEYVNNGDLHRLLKAKQKLSQQMIRYLGEQLVLGVEYIHSMGVIHRDLKPEVNILYWFYWATVVKRLYSHSLMYQLEFTVE